MRLLIWIYLLGHAKYHITVFIKVFLESIWFNFITRGNIEHTKMENKI